MQKYLSPKYHNYYMGLAKVAANNSQAERRKVGACVVLPNGLVSLGWNGTASGLSNVCEDSNGLTKPTVLHAEVNALKKLLVGGMSTKGAVVYVTLSPCLNCAVQLTDIGLDKVYYSELYRDSVGVEYLKSVGIEVEQLLIDEPEKVVIYEDDLGINFNGYPVDRICEEEVLEALRTHRNLRLPKNKAYKFRLEIEEC